MPEWTQIKYETNEGAATITLNRPEKKNALNATLIAEVHDAIETAGRDTAIRVIVLRGAGSDFCAGADLAQLEALSDRTIIDNLDDARQFAQLLQTMRRLGKCIIAAVHGRAFAGGAGLTAACDLVIACRSAKFSYPEVKIGFVPAMVAAIVRRNLGEARL
jgi:methylglutaconyl-CoA hydratase